MAQRGVHAVIVDEGQHLVKVSSGAKLLDQLDWIKSMTNMTGVVHVLVGTYDLLDFRNLNGQAARRGHDIHFWQRTSLPRWPGLMCPRTAPPCLGWNRGFLRLRATQKRPGAIPIWPRFNLAIPHSLLRGYRLKGRV